MNSIRDSINNSISRITRRVKAKFKAKPKLRTVTPNLSVPDSVPFAEHPNFEYPNNRVTTTKYTICNFICKNIFEQLHRYANMYFLGIQLINWIPGMEVFIKEVQMIPLLFVLLVTLLKDVYEDYGRYQSDQLMNNKVYRNFDTNKKTYGSVLCRDIVVGDIIHLFNDETVPADILILKANEEGEDCGTCYVETANLDGESNLKQRFAVHNFCDQGLPIADTNFDFVVECDQPSMVLHKFHGRIIFKDGRKIMVNKDNLLLRGCVVKNSGNIEGLVLYAGHETKSMLNNRVTPMKQSRLEKMINSDIIWSIAILIVMCSVSALGRKFWLEQFSHDNIAHSLFISPDGPIEEALFVWSLFGFIILYQMIIPISLYVCIEIVKMGQVRYIDNDENFIGTTKDNKVTCRAMNITEDLGQVEYMFCDKTGTLTENLMEFRCCTIKGLDYAHLPKESKSQMNCEKSQSKSKKSFKLNSQLKNKLESISSQYSKLKRSEIGPVQVDEMPDARKGNEKREEISLSEEEEMIRDFFVLLAICNTAMAGDKHTHQDSMNAKGDFKERTVKEKTSLDENATAKMPKPIYESESPDEVALVTAAFKYRVVLLKRTKDIVKLLMPNGTTMIYKVLNLLPFDSNRKRMSIIVRCPLTNRIVLFCKGADMTVLEKIKPTTSSAKIAELEQTQKNLTNYSTKGYRVLCMARRYLTEEQYNKWHENYQNAQMHAKCDRRIAKCFESIEDNLELLGATAIEDRLQYRVPEVIALLKAAGIAIWVLTGDKMETALNIANSCHLFNSSMQIIEITLKTVKSKTSARELLLQKIGEIRKSVSDLGHKSAFEASNPSPLHRKIRLLYDLLNWEKNIQFVNDSEKAHWGLVIDGPSLNYVLDKENSNLFIELTQYCNSVLCCRATPIQKAVVVKCVKNKLSALTMAVGDGANDVVMIQTANVGVGISGVEGTQAVMASDFAIPKFHHLERLILVHGNLCYNRLALTVLYFFYKNTISILMIFFFQFFCGFSGQSPIDDLYLMLVNICFTTFPPVVRGIFEKDCDEAVLLQDPTLYERGRNSRVYTKFSFWVNTTDAIYQSIVIYFVTYGFYMDTSIGIYEFGLIIFTLIILTNLLQIALETKYWPPIYIWSFILSFGFYFLTVFMLDWWYSEIILEYLGGQNYKVFYNIVQDSRFWFSILIIPLICVMPRCSLRTIQEMVKPQFNPK